jgi:hypothetical protein
MSQTFRRDKLRRLIEAGRVVRTESYHFDDMMGQSITRVGKDGAVEMPVKMTDASEHWTRPEGFVYLYPSDLTGHGRAHQNADGTVTLYVHSNCNFTFRILPVVKS